jgi:hypothetical protein
MTSSQDEIAATSDAVNENDIIVTLDLKSSGGPSLVHGIVHRSSPENFTVDSDEAGASVFLEAQDMAEIVAVSKLRWGYDPQKFTCPYCKVEDFSANHLEHTPFVWAGENRGKRYLKIALHRLSAETIRLQA